MGGLIKKSKRFCVIFILSLLFSCKSNTQQIKLKDNKPEMLRLIKDSLDLNSIDLKFIENNNDLLKDLVLTIRDSIPIKVIKPQLDSLFQKKYNKKEVITNLELYRFFKGRNLEIFIKRDVDSSKVLNFNSVKELEEFMKKKNDSLKN